MDTTQSLIAITIAIAIAIAIPFADIDSKANIMAQAKR
jgi:hypothetical protein